MSFEDKSGIDFATSRGRDWPSVRQFNVFLANRMGALLELVKRFETTDVKLVALTVVETADCAIIRIVPSDPERAFEILQQAKFAFSESDLLVVKLPDNDQPLLSICKALLGAEINIHYAYPLLIGVGPMGSTAVALHVEDFETAVNTLNTLGFTIFTENDLDS
ncbi:MAG TPA: acetolactate synthase [Gemmataceae bacterium]|nr:acetolactate synthase [Gemmataceae bacterium]